MLHSTITNKIQKAKRYAAEPDRVQFESLKVHFAGVNNDHAVEFNAGRWNCDCGSFLRHDRCSHTMAMEQMLEGMVAEGSR